MANKYAINAGADEEMRMRLELLVECFNGFRAEYGMQLHVKDFFCCMRSHPLLAEFTESYLYRLFKRELFKTPKKYLTEKRLLHAQRELKKGGKPTEVAEACGFDDYTTFYRNYVDHFGKAPSEER